MRTHHALVLLACAATALAACSSTVEGQGRQDVAANRTVSSSSSSASSSAPPTTSAPPSTAGQSPVTAAPQAPAPNTVTVTAPAPSRTATPSATPSTSATSAAPTNVPSPSTPPQVLNVKATAHCASHQDPNGYADLSWTSNAASDVWILRGPNARSSQDARGSSGSGPYPPIGSGRFSFDCSGAADYYRVDAYEGSSNGGLLTTVPYPGPN